MDGRRWLVAGLLLASVANPAAAGGRWLALRGRGGRPVAVEAGVAGPEALARAWLLGEGRGPKAAEAGPWLPVASVDSVEARGPKVVVRVTLVPGAVLDPRAVEDAILALANTLDQEGIRSLVLLARPGPAGAYVPVEELASPPAPVPSKPWEVSGSIRGDKGAQPGWSPPEPPAGALSGKSVFVSQSHGWYWDPGAGEWLTQRGNTNDLVEDFINAEAVDQYLIHYLRNAGAGVYTCRERDMQTAEAIVDDGDAAYAETGTWQPGSAGSGFWGAGDRVAPSDPAAGVSATWTLAPPTAGRYAVSAWARGGSAAARHARYTVRHAGGETALDVDLQRDGYTWRFLGFFRFDPSDPPSRRAVVLEPTVEEPGLVLVADAVRIGGGMGSIADGGSTSGRPRWEESGLYFAPFMGCDACATNTVTAMPRYAAWENEAWEDPVYLSWHTNAPDPGTGTSSFVYSSAGWDGTFDGVAGSQELQQFVHSEIIDDIRAGYDPGWTDRGMHTANFGEVNPSNNDEMPAVLVELAFHATSSDAADLKDPKFRMLAARAMYQGIVRYFAWKDGVAVHLLPEPPTHLSAEPRPDGSIRLRWHAPPYDTGDGLLGDPAQRYRIYRTGDPLGPFVRVGETAATEYRLEDVAPGETVYLRVTAVNAGGESFPTPVGVARVPEPGEPRVLVVDGFDRLDAAAMVPQYESDRLGWVDRMFLSRMNTFGYAITHGEALRNVAVGVASAANEAVEGAKVDLGVYAAVDWFLGEESTVDETFSAAEQQRAAAYLDGGGRMLVTGAELAWDLDHSGSDADRTFLADRLHAAYVQDDSGSYSVTGTAGGPLDGLAGIVYDDGTRGIYEVDYPDALDPASGGTVAASYDGTSLAACTAYDGASRTLVCGFPFETIADGGRRAAFMEAAMAFLLEGRSCRGGDADLSGTLDGGDTRALLGVLFAGGDTACPDTTCDGRTDARDLAAVVAERADPGAGPCGRRSRPAP